MRHTPSRAVYLGLLFFAFILFAASGFGQAPDALVDHGPGILSPITARARSITRSATLRASPR